MLATFSIHMNPIETKDVQLVPNFKEYNERRVRQADLRGAMKDEIHFDQ